MDGYSIDMHAPLKLTFAKSKARGLCQVRGCRRLVRAGKEKMCSTCAMRVWRSKNPIQDKFTKLKSRAKKRGIPFFLQLGNFKRWCEETQYHLNSGATVDELHCDRIQAFINGKPAPYAIWNIRVLTCSQNSYKGAYMDKIQKRIGGVAELELDSNEPF